MKKISVILTTFNSAKYIDRVIPSILNQEGNGFEFEIELIVVDDCSTDETIQKLKKYGLQPMTTGVNSGGPNRGRNIGLKHVTGDFICIVDHDDEWKSTKLLTLLKFLDQADIVTSGYTMVNLRNGHQYEVVSDPNSSFLFFKENETFIKKLEKNNKAQNTYLGSLIFKSSLKGILFEEHFGMIDYDWILRLFHNQSSIEVCKTLYVRYVSEFNLSLNENYRRTDYYYSLMFIEKFEDIYPRSVQRSRGKINGTRARFYYLIGNMKKARFHFRRATLNWRNLGYYITTYFGSKWVRERVKILR